jgi:hypothetical protein
MLILYFPCSSAGDFLWGDVAAGEIENRKWKVENARRDYNMIRGSINQLM